MLIAYTLKNVGGTVGAVGEGFALQNTAWNPFDIVVDNNTPAGMDISPSAMGNEDGFVKLNVITNTLSNSVGIVIKGNTQLPDSTTGYLPYRLYGNATITKIKQVAQSSSSG